MRSTPIESKEYLSCAETAVLVRKALAVAFPGFKFSVRSKNYSGGASIDVSWTDGPRPAEVEKVLDRYEGATFDGMTDLKSHHDSVIVGPDGAPRRVHFGADYVFASRRLTDYPRWHGIVLAMISARCVLNDGRFGNEYPQDLANRTAHDLDFRGDIAKQLDAAFRRRVYREEGFTI